MKIQKLKTLQIPITDLHTVKKVILKHVRIGIESPKTKHNCFFETRFIRLDSMFRQ